MGCTRGRPPLSSRPWPHSTPSVTVENLTNGKGPVSARSLMGIMSFGCEAGRHRAVRASGGEADRAVAKLTAMATDGFGELG